MKLNDILSLIKYPTYRIEFNNRLLTDEEIPKHYNDKVVQIEPVFNDKYCYIYITLEPNIYYELDMKE